MKPFSLLLIFFSLTNSINGQEIISRLDITHTALNRDQLKVAATVLKSIELDKFELINGYLADSLIKNDNRLISSHIEKHNINIAGYPPLIQQPKESLERRYSRAYYKSNNAIKEILFIANLSFNDNSNKVTSVEIIKTTNNNFEKDLFYSYINKIVCNNPPVGPPAIGNLIDFETGKKKKNYKNLMFRKDDIDKLHEIYQYKEYNLSCTFIEIPKTFFDTSSIWTLNNIVSLKISELNGELKSITPRIGGLKYLKKLELSLQNTKVPIEIFELKNLEELKIYSEEEINLSTALKNITRLENLKILTIYNNISSFPEEICSLQNLEEFILSTKTLTSIPERIGELKKLSKLVISGSFKEIPHEIGKLENLISLNLGSRYLKSLPRSIGKLNNLSSLSISKATNLEFLPKEIGNIKNISHLNFNKVEKLPKLEASISNISKLYIYYAKDITGINNYLGGARKLRLMGCEIDTLPNIFDYSNNLVELAIHDSKNLNHFKSSTNIPQKLRTVKIGNTGLEEIPPEILLLTNLYHLSFEQSKLKKIPLEIINFSNLKELRLSRNLIEEIPLAILKLNKCNAIYLNYNKITEIDKEIANFESGRKLKVYLYGNQFDPSIKLNKSIFNYEH